VATPDTAASYLKPDALALAVSQLLFLAGASMILLSNTPAA
jgi:hypothetical protein